LVDDDDDDSLIQFNLLTYRLNSARPIKNQHECVSTKVHR